MKLNRTKCMLLSDVMLMNGFNISKQSDVFFIYLFGRVGICRIFATLN